MTELGGSWTTTIVVDSMQVYRELPIITNQERDRPAELIGITSVIEEWTISRHESAASEVLNRTEGTFVLDAGTGMYLNAILLDMDIAPKVSPEIRRKAEAASHNAANPRRFARERELHLAGAPPRGSIWSGEPVYDTTVIYLRPDRALIDSSISDRSKKIVRAGYKEAQDLMMLHKTGHPPNHSVRSSIGVKELVEVYNGVSSMEDAETRISARTRKLARRQMQWFDKLARKLEGRAKIKVFQDSDEIKSLNSMFDIIVS